MSVRIERTGPRRPWQENLTAENSAPSLSYPVIDYDFEFPGLRSIAKALVQFSSLYNQFEIHGLEHFPVSGPAILVFRSTPLHLDELYFSMNMYLKTGRLIQGLGSKRTFQTPGLKQLAHAVGLVSASGSFDRVREMLSEGRLIALSYDQLNDEWIECLTESGAVVLPIYSENAEFMYSKSVARPLFKHFIEKSKFGFTPVLGLGLLPFPVAVKTWISEPLQFTKRDSVGTFRHVLEQALCDLNNRHPARAKNIVTALRQRFKGRAS